MALYFHRITVFALPVNMIILPLLVVLIPSALLTLIVTLLSPTAAAIPGILTAVLLHARSGTHSSVRSYQDRRFSHSCASASPGSGFLPSARRISMACALWQSRTIELVAPCCRHRDDCRCSRRGDCLGQSITLMTPSWSKPLTWGKAIRLLLITPDGKTMLVDGGGFGGGPRQAAQNFDIGEEVVSPVLWSRGIRHLDVVALSHAHSDHMGGLSAVLAQLQAERIMGR